MGNKRDYYDVLGVKRDVGEAELKSAYRKLGKMYHPDAKRDDPEAEAKMKEINEAYDVLSDSEKRAEYDQHGNSAFAQGEKRKAGDHFTGGSNFNYDDLFRGPFGDIFNERKKNLESKSVRDISVGVQINFEESLSGTNKEVSFSFSDICTSCNGSGSTAGTVAESCKHCNGLGQEQVVVQSGFGKIKQRRECPVCRGKGMDIKSICSRCSGYGIVKVNKKIMVIIPKGIRNGQSVSIKGMGELNVKDGSRGNLLIKVTVRSKRGF